jgi:uncharacterized membrane protein YraQ (UPF0718 family)
MVGGYKIESIMLEAIKRELIYFWFYSSVLFNQIAVYWFFGMILGSLISVFGKKKLHSMFAAMKGGNLGLLGLIPASLIGIASPLCMYGTIPISASFAEKGVREDWLAAFMMSSILLNPQLLFYSAALGNAALIIRIASCFACDITAGLLVHFIYKRKKFFNFKGFAEAQDRDTDPNLLLRFMKNLLRNVKATGPAFLIGISLAALFQRFVPTNVMASLFGEHRGFGLLMAASVGVPLYVCGGGTIPLLISWM